MINRLLVVAVATGLLWLAAANSGQHQRRCSPTDPPDVACVMPWR